MKNIYVKPIVEVLDLGADSNYLVETSIQNPGEQHHNPPEVDKPFIVGSKGSDWNGWDDED